LLYQWICWTLTIMGDCDLDTISKTSVHAYWHDLTIWLSKRISLIVTIAQSSDQGTVSDLLMLDYPVYTMIYIHTYILYIHVWVYIYTYIYVYIHIYIHVYIYIYTYIYIYYSKSAARLFNAIWKWSIRKSYMLHTAQKHQHRNSNGAGSGRWQKLKSYQNCETRCDCDYTRHADRVIVIDRIKIHECAVESSGENKHTIGRPKVD